MAIDSQITNYIGNCGSQIDQITLAIAAVKSTKLHWQLRQSNRPNYIGNCGSQIDQITLAIAVVKSQLGGQIDQITLAIAAVKSTKLHWQLRQSNRPNYIGNCGGQIDQITLAIAAVK